MAITPGGRGPQLMGVTGFFLGLTTIAVVLRVYCRVRVVKSFGFDDWFALVAWVMFVLFGTFVISGVYHGTGQHMVDIKPQTEIPIGLKWWWACEVVYVLSNMALKLSIGAMLLRLTVLRTHRVIIYITIAITEAYCVFFFFIFIFQCQAPEYFWTQYTGGKGSCLDPQIAVSATYGYSAIACVGDWIFAIIPIFLVWDLQMNSRKKVAVAMVLSMGAIASAATIVRLPYVHTLKDRADFLYATSDVAIWSCAETGLGIAACSIATLRPLFRAFFSRKHLMGDTSSNKMSANAWPTGAWPSQGYKLSKSQGGTEEYNLRSDVGRGGGVITVIESDRGLDLESGERGRNVSKFGSQKTLANGTGWRSSSESKRSLERSSGEGEMDWATGIRKTTVSNQVVS